MTKRMLVDATHPEETRVAIVESYRDHNRLEDLDYGLASKPILRGNIYLAKVMRIEPSLQAAFVEYGGNRHGFLPFSEIHPDYFRIPMADRSMEEEDAEEEIIEEENGEPESDEEGAAPTQADDDEAFEDDEPSGERPEERKETPPGPFAETMGSDDDTDVGLITDFGQATVEDSSLTEVAMPEAPPESVGGEVTESIVRPRRNRYKIQEVLKRGQVMLIQVVKEERGNKGAALTTFLSLAGRYCVLMPNTDHGGGVSRKITNHHDRRRMKEILDQLEIPQGMAVILRTAGMEQSPPDIQRDLDYLLKLWDNIREQTLQSSAPALIYEEANLIKRSVRDLYSHDIDEILIAGQDGYVRARDFMQAIMPDHVEKIKYYDDAVPLFIRFQVENQIDALHTPIAQLRSGGYLVINPTEALVSIDVNSGRATRERHIEETALKTNLEAADEIARQLRLRDLAGLVVIDFIDMEDGRNNAAVERRMKEAMKNDRARLQIGRISPFGLMELSRQRLRPSLNETNFEKCPHCSGMGIIRSADSAALSILRAIEEEAIRGRADEIKVSLPSKVAVYILNHKRAVLTELEKRYAVSIVMESEEIIPPPGYKLERSKNKSMSNVVRPAVNTDKIFAETEQDLPPSIEMEAGEPVYQTSEEEESPNRRGRRGRRRNDRRTRGRHGGRKNAPERAPEEGQNEAILEGGDEETYAASEQQDTDGEHDPNNRRRRRGRRGGRRRHSNDTRRGPEQADWKPPAHETAGALGGYSAHEQANIPTSIHEIDTTPKPLHEEKASSRSYEVVNPPIDSPKAGWWRRLTGQ